MPVRQSKNKSRKSFAEFNQHSGHLATPPCWCRDCEAETILADRKRQEIRRKLLQLERQSKRKAGVS